MKHQAGPKAQIWCHTRFTHWMCSGYRFDILEGKKVEGLCTCTCHYTGAEGRYKGISHAQNMVDDPERFERARLIDFKLHDQAGLTDDDYPHEPLE